MRKTNVKEIKYCTNSREKSYKSYSLNKIRMNCKKNRLNGFGKHLMRNKMWQLFAGDCLRIFQLRKVHAEKENYICISGKYNNVILF